MDYEKAWKELSKAIDIMKTTTMEMGAAREAAALCGVSELMKEAEKKQG